MWEAASVTVPAGALSRCDLSLSGRRRATRSTRAEALGAAPATSGRGARTIPSFWWEQPTSGRARVSHSALGVSSRFARSTTRRISLRSLNDPEHLASLAQRPGASAGEAQNGLGVSVYLVWRYSWMPSAPP